jgi:hypothetical protein
MRGFVFYDGPSLIDGAPIIGIAVLESRNAKTGDMVQTFILRADQDPISAIQAGADKSICGDCKHRGPTSYVDISKRTCYVDVYKSVLAVFSAWCRGSYPLIDPVDAAWHLVGREVRIGAYGDPAAIPAQHWRDLIRFARGRTGYSHQWRQAFAQDLRSIVMASADSPAERDLAVAMGWRTFRVRTAAQPIQAGEISCPASDEAGNRRQCIDCLACDGADRTAKASVAIIVHGAMARHFASV